MTQPYLIRTTVQLHAREASANERLRSNGVRGLEADFGTGIASQCPSTGDLRGGHQYQVPGGANFDYIKEPEGAGKTGYRSSVHPTRWT
jgi:hypothetical protein